MQNNRSAHPRPAPDKARQDPPYQSWETIRERVTRDLAGEGGKPYAREWSEIFDEPLIDPAARQR